ncbi:MAG: Uma2 family endonuclease [Anaerolineae bacterium]|nr:Uma2 family endonuclease [Anaerolineae bacterium]
MVTRAGVTIQEFIDLVERHPDQHFDLTAEGEIIEVSPKLIHGLIQARVAYLLNHWFATAQTLVGYVVVTEVAHDLAGWLCRPDVSINRADDEAIPKQAPLLAVEIKSDANTYSDLRAKARKYLELGTKMVWLVYPDKQLIEVYQADADDQILTADDSLDGGAMLPGFSVAVKALFE